MPDPRLFHASFVQVGPDFEVLAMAAPDPSPGGSFCALRELGIQRAVFLLGTEAAASMYGHLGGLETLYRNEGIDPLHVPTPNMGVPRDASSLSQAVEHLLRGPTRTSVVHCRAGVGRTGLTLVATMMRLGMPLNSALGSLRSQRYPLQSRSQHQALEAYAAYLAGEHPS